LELSIQGRVADPLADGLAVDADGLAVDAGGVPVDVELPHAATTIATAAMPRRMAMP
jgi:sugar lactone lactonase YvrE